MINNTTGLIGKCRVRERISWNAETAKKLLHILKTLNDSIDSTTVTKRQKKETHRALSHQGGNDK